MAERGANSTLAKGWGLRNHSTANEKQIVHGVNLALKSSKSALQAEADAGGGVAPRPPRQGSNSSFTGAGVIPGLGFCFNKFLHSHVLPKPWQAPHRHGAGSLARAGSAGGEPHSPVPQGCLAVESCSRLSQGWDTGRSCWDTKSSAVPDVSRNRAQRKEERIQWGKSSFTLPASQALLPCLHTCQSLLPEKYLRSHLSVAGA